MIVKRQIALVNAAVDEWFTATTNEIVARLPPPVAVIVAPLALVQTQAYGEIGQTRPR